MSDPLAMMERALAEHGAAALRAVHADLVAIERPDELGINALSWLGGRVSWHLRRAVLLKELEAADWNLGAVGASLRMGGAGNVTKVIRELGLADELEKARAEGKATQGVQRTKRGAK